MVSEKAMNVQDADKASGAGGFIKNFLSFSVATWVGAVLSFLVTPIVTRVFSTDELGKVNMFITVGTLLEYIGLLGMNQGYIRFFNEPIGRLDKNKLYKLSLNVSLLCSLIISILLCVFRKTVSVYIVGGYYWYIPVFLAIYVISKVFLTMSSTKYRMEKNALPYTIQQLFINFAVKVSYVFAAFSVADSRLAIMYICVIDLLLTLAFAFVQRKSLWVQMDGRYASELKTILVFSLPMVASTFLSYFNTSIPKLVLKKFIDYSAIGVYSAAVTLVSIIGLLQVGFSVFWAPYVYENYKSNQKKIKTIHIIVTVLIVLMGLTVLLGSDLIYLIIGKNFRTSKSYFALLLISPILYTVAETTGLGINISKKSYLNIIISALMVALNLIISYLLIPVIGEIGAAIAVAVASVGMFVTKTAFGEKYYNVIDSWYKTLAAPVLFIIAVIVNTIMFDNTLVRTGITAICIAAVVIIYIKELKRIFATLYELVCSRLKNNRNKG